jgi:hypothetical protein
MLITRTELPSEPRRWRLVSSPRAEPGRDFAIYVDNYLYCIGDAGLEAILLETKTPFIAEMTEHSMFPQFFDDLIHKTDLDIDCLATDEAAFLRLDGRYYTRRQAEHIYNALKAYF